MAKKYTHTTIDFDDGAWITVEEHTHLRLNYYVIMGGTHVADGYVAGFRALGDARSFAFDLADRIGQYHNDKVGA